MRMTDSSPQKRAAFGCHRAIVRGWFYFTPCVLTGSAACLLGAKPSMDSSTTFVEAFNGEDDDGDGEVDEVGDLSCILNADLDADLCGRTEWCANPHDSVDERSRTALVWEGSGADTTLGVLVHTDSYDQDLADEIYNYGISEFYDRVGQMFTSDQLDVFSGRPIEAALALDDIETAISERGYASMAMCHL